MGLFDSAIQNLSRMALNESGVEIPQVTAPALVDEFKATLDMMPSLLEEEMEFPVYAVPIRKNKRLGRYLIEMEDLSRYMLTNGITNILEAITYIGNNNGVRLDNTNVALVIDEASILQEMDDLGMNIGGSNSNEGNIGTVGLLGPHTDIGKFRRFANSREIVDTVANKYGLPLVKKNYTIGLVPVKHGDIKHDGNLQESAEETQARKGGSEVLQEKPGVQKVEPKGGDFGDKPNDKSVNETTLSEFIRNGNRSNDQTKAMAQANGPNAGITQTSPTTKIGSATATKSYINPADYAKFKTGPTNAQIAANLGKSDAHAQDMLRRTNAAQGINPNSSEWGNVKPGTTPESSGGARSPGVMHASAALDPNLQYLRDIALGKYDAEIMNEEYGARY